MMSTGFGFCPTCGTPRTAADQKFCGTCGSSFAVGAQSAPPVAAPVPPVAPAEEPLAPSPWAPPGVAAVQTAAQAVPSDPAAPGPVPPVAPARLAAGHKSRRPLLVLGGLALAAIVGVFAYMNMNSTSANGGSTSANGGSTSGGINITPSTFGCTLGNSTQVTSTVRLPSSVADVEHLTWQIDGVSIPLGLSITSWSRDLTKQRDGSWLVIETDGMRDLCDLAAFETKDQLATHTMSVLDASGKIVAQGSFTLTR